MSKTALYVQNTPGGMYAIEDQSLATGSRFYVDSNTGTDQAGSGRSPDDPVATVDYAVGLCTASKGDIVYVMPGHVEDLVAATSCAVDVAGVQIIGMGVGSLQPTFTLKTATTATIAVTAANVRIKNIKVISDLADVAAGITASAAADGLLVEDCWFTDGAETKELVIGISCAAACDRVIIRNCRFQTVDSGGCASAVKFVGASANSEIYNNYMHGDYSVACIDGVTAGGTFMLIRDNVLWNTDAAAGLVVSLHADTTGAFVRNLMYGGKNGTSPYSAAGVLASENYGTNAAAASGIILPAVDV
jgi:hypothetical protein